MFRENLLFILILSFLFSLALGFEKISNSDVDISNTTYFTGNDGVIKFNVNIWGSVRNPGRVVLSNGDNILSAISLAGGILEGANLKKIKIYRSSNLNRKYFEVNLHEILLGTNTDNFFLMEPNDVIVIEESLSSKFFKNISYYNALLNLFILTYNLGFQN